MYAAQHSPSVQAQVSEAVQRALGQDADAYIEEKIMKAATSADHCAVAFWNLVEKELNTSAPAALAIAQTVRRAFGDRAETHAMKILYEAASNGHERKVAQWVQICYLLKTVSLN